MSSSTAYTTKHEMEFLDGLQFDLLPNYILACNKRKRWGEINKNEVVKYAAKLLACKRKRHE